MLSGATGERISSLCESDAIRGRKQERKPPTLSILSPHRIHISHALFTAQYYYYYLFPITTHFCLMFSFIRSFLPSSSEFLLAEQCSGMFFTVLSRTQRKNAYIPSLFRARGAHSIDKLICQFSNSQAVSWRTNGWPSVRRAAPISCTRCFVEHVAVAIGKVNILVLRQWRSQRKATEAVATATITAAAAASTQTCFIQIEQAKPERTTAEWFGNLIRALRTLFTMRGIRCTHNTNRLCNWKKKQEGKRWCFIYCLSWRLPCCDVVWMNSERSGIGCSQGRLAYALCQCRGADIAFIRTTLLPGRAMLNEQQ